MRALEIFVDFSVPRSGSDANRYPPKLEVQEKIQPMDDRETCVLTGTRQMLMFYFEIMELRTNEALVRSRVHNSPEIQSRPRSHRRSISTVRAEIKCG